MAGLGWPGEAGPKLLERRRFEFCGWPESEDFLYTCHFIMSTFLWASKSPFHDWLTYASHISVSRINIILCSVEEAESQG